ncbi:MAG: cytochrome bd-I oxidase subunit CydX [Devosia sp.]
MWYFSWILGVGLACSFGILNAMWYEFREDAAKGKEVAATVPPALPE